MAKFQCAKSMAIRRFRILETGSRLTALSSEPKRKIAWAWVASLNLPGAADRGSIELTRAWIAGRLLNGEKREFRSENEIFPCTKSLLCIPTIPSLRR
jgi:hypothetical protein